MNAVGSAATWSAGDILGNNGTLRNDGTFVNSFDGNFILANGALSSNQGGEGEIRRAITQADLVDCVVALPDRLFYSTQIPVSLWIVTFAKRLHKSS